MVTTPELNCNSAVLTPETVVKPAPEVITFKGLMLPFPVTFPAKLITPVPALKMAGLTDVPLFVIPVLASPKVIVVLVVATVP